MGTWLGILGNAVIASIPDPEGTRRVTPQVTSTVGDTPDIWSELITTPYDFGEGQTGDDGGTVCADDGNSSACED